MIKTDPTKEVCPVSKVKLNDCIHLDVILLQNTFSPQTLHTREKVSKTFQMVLWYDARFHHLSIFPTHPLCHSVHWKSVIDNNKIPLIVN